MKYQVKTMDEYACELISIAPPEVFQVFLEHMKEGNLIHAIKILRKYKLIEK